MKCHHTPVVSILLISLLGSSQALAGDWADRITIGGFASANYNLTDSEVSFNGEENIGYDDKGSWSGTRMGFNINAEINDRFRLASQFFASKAEDFDLHIDWAFGDLTITDEINIRAGKIKFPVGLVNEYAQVGYTLPWIVAPVAIYTELGAPNGPQMTRESYTGVSAPGNITAGDWTMGADLFGGEVALEGANVRQLSGVNLTADWDDSVLFKASAYQGTMSGVADMTPGVPSPMNGAKHQVLMYGVKTDWNDIIFYAERGDVTMSDLPTMKATSWYTTLGYQMGDWLPHLTYQSYEQGKSSMQEDQQNIVTLGLRWDFLPNVAFKTELSQIRTDKGVGLFVQDDLMNPTPAPGTVNMIALGLDTIF